MSSGDTALVPSTSDGTAVSGLSTPMRVASDARLSGSMSITSWAK